MEIVIPCTQFELANGLRVVVHEDRRTPLACVNVWYHVGSKDEHPGRTGFAHLFEHLMFTGSEHVPEGRFDRMLEEVGGINNGSTSTDRTNYWETVPAHAVDLALYLEADRMGGLLPAITSAQLEAQRGVVQNERRQSYENRPYGLASETMYAALYPAEHPYSWPVIGWMADITAATLEDVHHFCRTYYTPGNATIAIAGDVETSRVRALIERWFGDIPRGAVTPPVAPPPVLLGNDQRIVMEDDVSLPRLYIGWHTAAAYAEGDAALDILSSVLTHGGAARLYRMLVYDQQTAQSVSSYQGSALLGSIFRVSVTARPGVSLSQLEETVRREIAVIARDGITQRELDRARNGVETAFIDALQSSGGFGGRADQLNTYLFHTGEPDWFARDLERYQRLTTADIRDVASAYLLAPSIVLSVVPRGHSELAA